MEKGNMKIGLLSPHPPPLPDPHTTSDAQLSTSTTHPTHIYITLSPLPLPFHPLSPPSLCFFLPYENISSNPHNMTLLSTVPRDTSLIATSPSGACRWFSISYGTSLKQSLNPIPKVLEWSSICNTPCFAFWF
ncbi:hypothetical protein GBA52_002612 [Prunus armeniaca]|nr:hypothetical protein GBA52_002612 [Prunus armeniaca]